MPKFHHALRAWKTDAFDQFLKSEIANLKTGTLPLDKGVSQGGYVDDSHIEATVLHVADDENAIQADVGIFFTEIVGGCSCGDDPMATNAYCVIQARIDKATAEVEFALVKEPEQPKQTE